jgi:hypothetical protein
METENISKNNILPNLYFFAIILDMNGDAIIEIANVDCKIPY